MNVKDFSGMGSIYADTKVCLVCEVIDHKPLLELVFRLGCLRGRTLEVGPASDIL